MRQADAVMLERRHLGSVTRAAQLLAASSQKTFLGTGLQPRAIAATDRTALQADLTRVVDECQGALLLRVR